MSRALTTMILVGAAMALAGCPNPPDHKDKQVDRNDHDGDERSRAEKAGDRIENRADKAGERIENAGDRAKERLDEADEQRQEKRDR